MKRILITGAYGFIGRHLSNYLTIGNQTTKTYHHDITSVAENICPRLDVTLRARVFESLEKSKPQVVVHLAGIKDVGWCQRNPDLAHKINVEGTINVADAARAVDAFVIYLSSNYVFDGSRGNYLPEDATNPATAYGHTKQKAEKTLRESGTRHVILRSADVYSLRRPMGPMFEAAQDKLERHEIIKAFTNVFHTPTGIDDVVGSIGWFCKSELEGVFHLAGPESMSQYDLLRKFAARAGLDPEKVKPTLYAIGKDTAFYPPNLGLNSESTYATVGKTFHAFPEASSNVY